MKYKIIVFSFLVTQSLFSYIYQLQVLRKWDKIQKKFQYIICCGDFHDKSNHMNAQHRKYLQNIMKLHKKKCNVIIEDLSSPNIYYQFCRKGVTINSRGGLLGCLANDLRNNGICVRNIEYRYARVAGLCPLFNNVSEFEMSLAKRITTIDVHQEIMDQIKQIKAFGDTKQLSLLYSNAIRSVERQLRNYAFERCRHLDMPSFCKKKFQRKKMDEYVQKLCTFDTALLDMSILHEVVNAHVPYVFVLAGGTHTYNVAQYLQKIGYKKVYSSNQSVKVDTLQSLQLPGILKKDVKKLPLAIDMRVIGSFLKK